MKLTLYTGPFRVPKLLSLHQFRLFAVLAMDWKEVPALDVRNTADLIEKVNPLTNLRILSVSFGIMANSCLDNWQNRASYSLTDKPSCLRLSNLKRLSSLTLHGIKRSWNALVNFSQVTGEDPTSKHPE